MMESGQWRGGGGVGWHVYVDLVIVLSPLDHSVPRYIIIIPFALIQAYMLPRKAEKHLTAYFSRMQLLLFGSAEQNRPSAGLMLAQRRRRWHNIKPTLVSSAFYVNILKFV